MYSEELFREEFPLKQIRDVKIICSVVSLLIVLLV